MSSLNLEKVYLLNTIIGGITALIALPIALFHFSIESTIFSALVPSIAIGGLVAIFSYSVYKKGRFRLYKTTLLNSYKLLILLILNGVLIMHILS